MQFVCNYLISSQVLIIATNFTFSHEKLSKNGHCTTFYCLCCPVVHLSVSDQLQTLLLPTDVSDYVEVISLKVVFSATVTRWYIQITINNDTLFEDDETFGVSLETDDSAVILMPDTATITIVDEDEGQFGLQVYYIYLDLSLYNEYHNVF